MRGDARRFTNSVSDLRRAGFNDRQTSFVVQPRGYAGGGYGGGYGNGGYGNGGYYDPRGDNGRYDDGRVGNGRYDDRYGRDDGRYPGGANGGSYQQASRMVQQAYRRVFGREPDRAAQPWVEEVLKNGWSQRQLEQALRNTPEGRGR